MSEQERWERTIAIYRQSYRELLALAAYLIETGSDLGPVAETIDASPSRRRRASSSGGRLRRRGLHRQARGIKAQLMELSDQLIEALDWMVETWNTPRTATSREAAHESACQVLEVLEEDYGDLDPEAAEQARNN
jgi:hypothetical protein